MAVTVGWMKFADNVALADPVVRVVVALLDEAIDPLVTLQPVNT